MTRYWHWFSRGFLVTVHLDRDFRFRWTRVIGLQVGPWFLGAIKGSRADGEDKPDTDASPRA